MVRAEALTGPVTRLGEGPLWEPEAGRLYWVDIPAGDVLSMSELGGEVSRTHVADVVTAVRPVAAGGLVLAVERGFGFLRTESTAPVLLPELWTDPGVRMNDGGCDPQGRFYAGSMAYDETPGAGRLWQLDHGGRSRVVLDGVTISNGLVWSHDGQTVYYVDTPTGRIDAFDFDEVEGALSRRRTVVRIPEPAGLPDGLAMDAEGRLWVALWGGAAVRCYDVDGALLDVIELPVRHVTACAFGGPGLDQLFITTARRADPEPEAGAIFLAEPGVCGVPVLPFTGTPHGIR